MPSDPVKALWWFMHWLLKVVVRFFWLPILAMMILEIVINGRTAGFGDGLVAGIITLLVGAVVWALLWGLLLIANVSLGVSQVISDVNRFQQQRFYQPPYTYSQQRDSESKIVEGTITDLEEERNKRRRE